LTRLAAGSPKLLTNQKHGVSAWFFSSGLSYTLPGAFEEADKAVDAIQSTIQEARQSEPSAVFFLEFVTCRAYVVKG
jgi:hypothetical protein